MSEVIRQLKIKTGDGDLLLKVPDGGDFIPLAGTLPGKPATGDFVFSGIITVSGDRSFIIDSGEGLKLRGASSSISIFDNGLYMLGSPTGALVIQGGLYGGGMVATGYDNNFYLGHTGNNHINIPYGAPMIFKSDGFKFNDGVGLEMMSVAHSYGSSAGLEIKSAAGSAITLDSVVRLRTSPANGVFSILNDGSFELMSNAGKPIKLITNAIGTNGEIRLTCAGGNIHLETTGPIGDGKVFYNNREVLTVNTAGPYVVNGMNADNLNIQSPRFTCSVNAGVSSQTFIIDQNGVSLYGTDFNTNALNTALSTVYGNGNASLSLGEISGGFVLNTANYNGDASGITATPSTVKLGYGTDRDNGLRATGTTTRVGFRLGGNGNTSFAEFGTNGMSLVATSVTGTNLAGITAFGVDQAYNFKQAFFSAQGGTGNIYIHADGETEINTGSLYMELPSGAEADAVVTSYGNYKNQMNLQDFADLLKPLLGLS